MDKLKEIIVPRSYKRSWKGGAYVIAFVYSKDDGNYVLKGYMKEVEQYLESKKHWFVNFTLWHMGRFRSIWEFWKDGIYISKPQRNNSHCYKWRFINFKSDTTVKFRRLPKRWVKELEIFD